MIQISDSHNDFMTKLTSKEKSDYLLNCKKMGVKIISCAIFTSNLKLCIDDLYNFKNEIVNLKNKYKDIFLLFSIEDIGFIHEEDIDKFIKLRPISCTLTWNFDNHLAGGALGKNGITILGKKIISDLEKNDIFIDTAHLNKKSFWEFSKITTKPIYNSHSNLYNLKRNKRNLTDKQIEKIVSTNGYLGLTLYDKFIGKIGNVNAKTIAYQFDYLIKKFGYKNFGLGTDFYGIDVENLPNDIKTYEDIKKIVIELKKLGYDETVIEHIIYKNYKNFLEKNRLIHFDINYK